MKKDTTYGRVKPVRSAFQGMKIKDVKVSYSLNDFTIFPKEGTFLRFETEENLYHIYNPFNLKFDLKKFLSQLFTYHCSVCGETFVAWSIEQSD